MFIVLSGKMGTGKSTIAKAISQQYNIEMASIGSKIKPMANLLIQNPPLFEKQLRNVLTDIKKTDVAIQSVFDYFRKNFTHAEWQKDENGQFIKNEPYRKLLQDFPMLVRKEFGEDVFARILIDDINCSIQNGQSFICDDMRLPGEKEFFESLGSIIIRLDIREEEQRKRLIQTYGKVSEESFQHPTEVALDHARFDLRIDVSDEPLNAVVSKIVKYLSNVEPHFFQ